MVQGLPPYSPGHACGDAGSAGACAQVKGGTWQEAGAPGLAVYARLVPKPAVRQVLERTFDHSAAMLYKRRRTIVLMRYFSPYQILKLRANLGILFVMLSGTPR